jgi:D-alanyl-D-alanine carboxypeptidase
MQLVADSIIRHTKVPGIVAWVVDREKGIDWRYTGGLANITEGSVMNSSHVFRTGSNTKTFTVTIVLQLVEEGKLLRA